MFCISSLTLFLLNYNKLKYTIFKSQVINENFTINNAETMYTIKFKAIIEFLKFHTFDHKYAR